MYSTIFAVNSNLKKFMKNIFIRVKTGEEKIFPLLWLGESDQKLKVRAVLDKPGASLKILGLFFGKSHRLELATEIIHRAPKTFSRTLVRGVLEGDASVRFEGRVLIEKGAHGADGDLNGHAILLSKTAKAVIVPRLEVLENEVKAGHGATVGKIDEEQLFYIMSRGLSLPESKRIIIQGFLGSLLAQFPKKQADKLTAAIGL